MNEMNKYITYVSMNVQYFVYNINVYILYCEEKDKIK